MTEEEKRKYLEALQFQYRRGFEDALRSFAIWKNGDGELFIGVMEEPLDEILKNLESLHLFRPPLNIVDDRRDDG